MTDLATGLVWFLSFLFSTTVHEAMHALVAWKLGDPTAYNGGQVSLSPIPHVKREPIGMLVLPLLTALTQGWAIGWASAPYDPYWANRYPNRAALMAAAGPAGNFLIAVAAFLVLRIGLGLGAFVAPERVNFETIVAGAERRSQLPDDAAVGAADSERASGSLQPAAAAAARRRRGVRRYRARAAGRAPCGSSAPTPWPRPWGCWWPGRCSRPSRARSSRCCCGWFTRTPATASAP